MATFHCPDQCDELCKPKLPCLSADRFWSDKIKLDSGEWPNKKEKSKKWTTSEKKLLLQALDNLPQGLWTPSLKGFYRKEASTDLVSNPAAFQNGSIAVYDAAFEGKVPLVRILAHELAHEYWQQLPLTRKTHYQIATGWNRPGNTGPWTRRTSGYVEDDGRIGPHEDFANNVEYFLFNRAKLEEETPGAAAWILQRFGSRFKTGAKCEAGNK